MWAQIEKILSSDWFSLLLTGKATADDGVAKGLRAQPEMTGNNATGTENDVTGTGNDVMGTG